MMKTITYNGFRYQIIQNDGVQLDLKRKLKHSSYFITVPICRFPKNLQNRLSR